MSLIRFPIRLLGLALIACALVLLADDVAQMEWPALAGFTPDPLGALIHSVAPQALNLTQAIIQRFVSPFLWDPILQTVLTFWDWAVFGTLGLLLATLARRPKDRPDPIAIETAG
ncbi:MAG: hypothetical protein KI785_02290 [Devosiaceae bacterium]|nr:hypothetical protein [Devosiaceae bacterium MH13]